MEAKQLVPIFSPVDQSKSNKLPYLLSFTHTQKQKSYHIQVTLDQSWDTKKWKLQQMTYGSSSLELLAISNTAWVIFSTSSSLCFENIHIISTATTLKLLSTLKHGCLWRKVREAIEEHWFLSKLLLHQNSWDRHIVFYFTHHKQTNNPQIWNPEFTKALNPSGFEKGPCFFRISLLLPLFT